MSSNLFNPSDRRVYPSRWKLSRGKELFRVIDVRSAEGKEELLTVSHITGITPRSQKSVTMFQAESLVGYKICHIGDIAANTMWTWQGAIGVSKYHGVVSPAYNVYRQRGDVFNPRYLDMLLRERKLVDVYHSLSTGIRGSRLRLYPDAFLTITFPVPPRDEQDQIVRFLDWKVSGINKLIAIYKEEITLLNTIKRALINDTIIKDTKQCMFTRLRNIAVCNGKTLSEITDGDYTFRYVDIGSVNYEKGITQYQIMKFKDAPSRARRVVTKKDIIISTVRTYLRAIVEIKDDADVIVSTGFAVITPMNIESKYLEYYCKSDAFCDEVMKRSNGIAYPAITTPALMDIKISVPKRTEQIKIAETLDKKCLKINDELEVKNRQIKKWQELKNRLISDAVTGKIDVRDVKIPEYEFVGEEAAAGFEPEESDIEDGEEE